MKNLKIKFIFFILILNFNSFAISQEIYDLWPIKGINTGDGIICKPQDYISEELNFDNLFITAPLEADVISPCSGIIISYHYTYKKTLTNFSAYKYKYNDTISVSEFDIRYRKAAADYYKNNYKYISISATIKTNGGKIYYISGIRPVQYFKTGTKINKGDIIGKVGYSYRGIKQPSISLSISEKSKPSDPMSVFGLKSTFISPSINKKNNAKNNKHTVSELIADFNIFRESLEEGHPGLYDYISKNDLNQIFEQTKSEIVNPMTSEEYRTLLIPVLKSIRDSHTVLINKKCKSQKIITPPILFGLRNDSLIVYSTLPEYKEFLSKQIIKIDDINVLDILPIAKKNVYGNDGFIHSIESRKLLMNFWKYYNVLSSKNYGDEIKILFNDGKEQIFKYSECKIENYIPKISKTESNVFSLSIIPNNIAIIDINSFQLSDTDLDSIANFVKQISDSSFYNLIIDVRDNYGGNPDAINYIFSLIADKPFKSTLYQKVNKKGSYDFFKYCLNYSATEYNMFDEYIRDEKKEGYFLPKNKFPLLQPDTSIHFGGNVYVLINEFSLSAATVFPSLIYKYKKGVIVGRETGASFYQLNATKFASVFLENTGLELYMPLIKSVFNEKGNSDIPWGRGVLPKYEIKINFNEFLNDNDIILDSTIMIINDNKTKDTYKYGKSDMFYFLGGIILLMISIFFVKRKII